MTHTPSKPWWQSRTIIGAVVSMLAMIAGTAGVKIAPELQGEITTILLTLAGVVGSGLSIYGRIKADKPIAKPGAGAAKVMLAAMLLGGLAFGGPVACASYTVATAEHVTDQQAVYAIQSDYNAALKAAAAYVESDKADPDKVAAIKRLDAVAYEALKEARIAARAGDGAAVPAAIGAARAAVSALAQYLTTQEIMP